VNTAKQFFQGGGELADYPGWYKIEGGTEDRPRSWSVIRKPDGTWWKVAAEHYFPTGGGNLRIDLGDEITDEDMLTQCEENYRQLLEKIEEKKLVKAVKPLGEE
jgi:hypothetical protein